MLTLLASHPPHPSPAQQCDSSIIHFNSKIKQAASDLSLHPFALNTVQCVALRERLQSLQALLEGLF